MNQTRARVLATLLVSTVSLGCGGSHPAQPTHDDTASGDASASGDAATHEPDGNAVTHDPDGNAATHDPDGGGAPATVRFFDDFYPTLLHPEYCLGVGDQWTGPLFAGNYKLDGYGWGGYQGLSPYASVAPGTYTLRVLSQYADTCDARIDGFADVPLPAPIAPGGAYTVAVSGDYQSDGGQPPVARMFADEIAPDDGPGRLRVINLAEKQGTLNVARINVNTPAGSDAQKPVSLFLEVQFGHFGDAPASGGAAGSSDANGYVTLPDDFYFYYNLPVYLHGGDVSQPLKNLKYTDPATLKGSWTLFFVTHPDADPSSDGTLGQSLCRDDGALDASKCE